MSSYILKAKNFKEMASAVEKEPYYDDLEDGLFEIECIKDLISGVWGVFISHIEPETKFTQGEIQAISNYLSGVDRKIDCFGDYKLGLKFDKKDDISPTYNQNYNDFGGKSYKTLPYARAIGLGMSGTLNDFHKELPTPNGDSMWDKFI